MLSTKYNQAASSAAAASNDRAAAPHKSKIQKLTRVKSHAELNARSSGSTSAHNSSAGQRRSAELDQWHKLMSDYERLQLVASSRAHNKLIRSSSESSLGSSSNLSQASTVVASSNSSSATPAAAAAANNTNQQRPTSMIARLSSGQTASKTNQNKIASKDEREEMRQNYAQESEIGQCLSELVESVVAAVATQATSERAKVTYEHEREPGRRPQPFRSFKLHEAILAKTLSSSSDNASSCDEAAATTTTTAQDKPGSCGRKRIAQVNSLGEFALSRQDAHDREHVIYAAREFACAHPAGDQMAISFSDDERQSTIKWIDANNNEGRLEMGQIFGCQQDDELIVWLLLAGAENPTCPTSDVGLDLDDIAMALNEPVSTKSAQQPQQIQALVWCCSNSLDARQLVDFWDHHNRNVAHKNHQIEQHQIEVKPCEVAANSSVAAEQMKSSGLFVLQQQPPVECTESREQTKQRPEVVKLAKSASTLDLTTSSSTRSQAISKPTEGANLLANYYRSVTNKMMGGSGSGNGGGSTSGRLRSFTQEVSKLNGRGQTTLAKSARRLSMALNQFSSSSSASGTTQHAQQTQMKSSIAPADVVLPPPPAVKPRTSVLKSSLASEQHALPRSILKRQCTNGSGSDERVDGSGNKSPTRVDRLERMKQRASCHDLAQLSAPSEETNDKERPNTLTLRAGSVASRSRQRRPALLLNDQTQHSESSAKTDDRIEAGVGMVRAKVSMSHLRRSASMKVLAAAPADEKVDDERQVVAANNITQEREPVPVGGGRKKSEFDPRSLRKLSNSEAAQALREGADYEASYEERKLRREKARRRRSMANLGELKGELDADAQQQVVAREEPTKVSAPSSFSKSFTLLRQSFRQKNFTSMLGLSNGGGRSANASSANEAEEPVGANLDTNAQIKQKLEAIKMAEANLLAAKQLKQQAQRLREQQKRNEQQLQIHKQQQQLIYQQQQQQYAQQSNRSHTQQQQLMFDPVHFHQQQQQQFYQAQQFQMYQQRQQQQQQQQLAYLSSSHSAAHFMAAAAAAAQPAMTLAPQLGGGSGVANHYGPAYGAPPPSAMMPFVPNHHLQPPAAAQAPINHSARLAANRYLYQQQQPPAHLMGQTDMQAHQQQFIPMSVNHHSSFNIVYTATSGGPNQHGLQVPPAHYQPHYVTQPYLAAPSPLPLPAPSTITAHMSANQVQPQQYFGLGHPVEMQQQQPAIRSKHSSLGASVRKTMRSVLSSGQSKSTKIVAATTTLADGAPPSQSKPGKPLKSALKSSASDGSDDASPASSSASSSSSSSSPLSSGSDSSLASSGSTQNSPGQRSDSKSATLTKRELERLRKDFIMNSSAGGGTQPLQLAATASELAAAAAAAQTRKNVTFSTKLTSIL